MRTRLAAAVVLVAVLTAVCSVWLVSGDEHRPVNARVADVASGLRCPTCTAVSVAASNSVMAQSMRRQIRHQLLAGRSPDQVRTWFVARYGRQVLLDPGTEGLGLLLWVLPAAALAAGAVTLLVTRHRAGGGEDAPAVRSPIPARRVALAGLAVVAVGTAVPLAVWRDPAPDDAAATAAARQDMDASDWVAVATSLERQGAYDAASEAYRDALRLRPGDPALRTRLAFVLVRDGHAEQALPLVTRLARRPGAASTDALLVLGLAQRAESMPQATATLREFLVRAPHHPAAAQVRRLLRDRG
jgi:cytochrome c-type biogenesis protein CcmH